MAFENPQALAQSLATQIVRNPTAPSSQKRYKNNELLYEKFLQEAGLNPNNPQSKNGDAVDTIQVACALILYRCGPKANGFEELKATATGGAVKSAVVNYWRKKGVDGSFFRFPDNTFSGNRGRCPDLQTMINNLDFMQKSARCHLDSRAYQETHEDVRKIYYRYIRPQLARAMRFDPNVDYKSLQVAVINVMQFSSISRGWEMLELQVQDLIFTGDNMNAPIVGVLPITKNRRKTPTYFRFQKQVDVSICGLSALQGWLCVLRSHGVHKGHIFLQVQSNALQGGTRLDGGTYAKVLRQIGECCGIFGLAEHSARRGGAGFYYFVLRRDLLFMYRAFSWKSLDEMMKYIGIEDVHNSYALLGFTAFGTNELYFPMHSMAQRE